MAKIESREFDWTLFDRLLECSSENFLDLVEAGQLNPAIDFRFADLSGLQIGDADLCSFDFTSSDLTDTNLAGANLAGANLTDTNLAGANLAGANLAGANLAGANLGGFKQTTRKSHRLLSDPMTCAAFRRIVDSQSQPVGSGWFPGPARPTESSIFSSEKSYSP
jgi:hypothetical protein